MTRKPYTFADPDHTGRDRRQHARIRYRGGAKQRRWCIARSHLWIERAGIVVCKRCGVAWD